jgi:hypothetical protein
MNSEFFRQTWLSHENKNLVFIVDIDREVSSSRFSVVYPARLSVRAAVHIVTLLCPVKICESAASSIRTLQKVSFLSLDKNLPKLTFI